MKRAVTLILLVTLHFSYSQYYLELINSGETSLSNIEEEANLYFERIGNDSNEYKFYQRWLYIAKMEADENGMLTPNSEYVKELQRFERERNFQTLSNHVSQTAPWEELGPSYKNASSSWSPGVGRITSMAFENTNHFIVGSPTGGVWKTTNGGQNWTCLTDNLSNIDVYSLAIHPDDSNIYFWGSTLGRIFKSTDGGASWSLLNGSSLLVSTVNKILIKPENPDIMYASARYAGVFRSTDGGISWSKIHADSDFGYDIEFKPGDTSEVYATGVNFFKSTNDGVSFTKYQGLPDLTIDGANWSQELISGPKYWDYGKGNQNQSITAKTGSGMALFFSLNQSSDSARLISSAIDLSGTDSAIIAFSYSNVEWVTDIDHLTVSYRNNAQDTWTDLATYTEEAASWTDIEIDISNVFDNSSTFQIAFTALSNYGHGVTLDDVQIKNTLGNSFFYEGFEDKNHLFTDTFNGFAKMIGVSAADPSKIYILEERNGIFNGLYVSTNNGINFTKLDHDNKNYFGYSSTADDGFGQAPRDMDILIDPNNANNVYMAGILSWRSADGGNSFAISSQWTPDKAQNEDIGYCHADIDIMEWVNGDLFVGSDGGVFIAPDPDAISANYYNDLSDGLGIREFYKIGTSNTDTEIISGGSQDNGTSVYAGGVWKDWLGADGMETFVDKNNNNILYGTSQYGNLYISYDLGVNARSILTPNGKAGSENGANWIVPFEQDPLVQDKIYVAYNEVFTTDNQGWVSISQLFNKNIDRFKIAPSNSDVMYLAIDNLFYKTTNGGQTDWTAVDLPENSGYINAIAINKDNPDLVALACSGVNKIILSSDGGTTWQVLNNGLPNFAAYTVCFYDEDLILGMNYGIFYNSARDRNTWDAFFSDNLPNARVLELEVNYTLNKVYAGTYGRGLWSAALDPTTLSQDKQVLEQIIIHPNPVKNNIELQLPQPISASLKLYNATGQIVYYAKKDSLEKTHVIPIENIPTGIYVLRISTDHYTAAFKIVKE